MHKNCGILKQTIADAIDQNRGLYMRTSEILNKIFKDPKIKYELTEFETLGKSLHEIIDIFPKTINSGREAGKIKYFMKSFVPFSSGKEEVQVF